MAEILEYGDGEGGYADLSQLQGLLSAADPALDDEAQQNRVRWAAVMACTMLRNHAGALEALVEAMEQRQTVTECVLAVETCQDVAGSSPEFVAAQEESRTKRLARGPFEIYLLRLGEWVGNISGANKGPGSSDSAQSQPLIREDEVLTLAVASTLGFLLLTLSGIMRI